MRLSAVFLPPDLYKKKVNEGVRLFFFLFMSCRTPCQVYINGSVGQYKKHYG